MMKTTRKPIRSARGLLVAFSLLATAAFAHDAPPQAVRQLDALEFSSVANTASNIQQPQISTILQNPGSRVRPHAIVLPVLTTATLPEPTPGQPLQIGVARTLPAAATAAATAGLLTWTPAADGSLRAAISVQSPGAKGLRLGLLVDQLPPGALLRVYAPGAAQTVQIAAAEALRTIQTNLDAGDSSAAAHTYWLPLVEGPQTALEIELPAGVDPALVQVALPLISHLLLLPTASDTAPLGTGVCKLEVDVMCTSGNQNEMRAVAMMSYINNGIGYVCSGTLLNNTRQDGTPYFLSANHCIPNQTVASTLQTNWNYRSASCNSSQEDSNYRVISSGAQLLYASSATDTSFMRLNSSPPVNAMFAGWEANTPGASLGTTIFGIHHPEGEWQKYSQGHVSLFATCTAPDSSNKFQCSSSYFLNNNTFYDVAFSQGVAEGGSSGSALFTLGSRRVIGQLYGGTISCSNPGGSIYYGRFDLPFNAALWQWLSPAPVTFTRAVSRKVHGAAGTFDLPISASGSLAPGSAITVEPRRGPDNAFDMVFQFSGPVTSASISLFIGGGAATITRISGNEVTVHLTGVPDKTRLGVALNVNGVANAASANIGFLYGDVDVTHYVTATDATVISARVGWPVNAMSFIYDIDLTGFIQTTDATLARARVGNILP